MRSTAARTDSPTRARRRTGRWIEVYATWLPPVWGVAALRCIYIPGPESSKCFLQHRLVVLEDIDPAGEEDVARFREAVHAPRRAALRSVPERGHEAGLLEL